MTYAGGTAALSALDVPRLSVIRMRLKRERRHPLDTGRRRG